MGSCLAPARAFRCCFELHLRVLDRPPVAADLRRIEAPVVVQQVLVRRFAVGDESAQVAGLADAAQRVEAVSHEDVGLAALADRLAAGGGADVKRLAAGDFAVRGAVGIHDTLNFRPRSRMISAVLVRSTGLPTTTSGSSASSFGDW